jgi:hypothetical protein
MLPARMHRKWAREFLARADAEPVRSRKSGYLKLAVANSVRAQTLEAEATETEATGESIKRLRRR